MMFVRQRKKNRSDVILSVAALERTGAFDAIEHQTSIWPLVLDAEQTVALYATFSNINIRSTARQSSRTWVASRGNT